MLRKHRWDKDECIRRSRYAEFDGGRRYLFIQIEEDGPVWNVRGEWGETHFHNNRQVGGFSWTPLVTAPDISLLRVQTIAWSWGVGAAQIAGYINGTPHFEY